MVQLQWWTKYKLLFRGGCVSCTIIWPLHSKLLATCPSWGVLERNTENLSKRLIKPPKYNLLMAERLQVTHLWREQWVSPLKCLHAVIACHRVGSSFITVPRNRCWWALSQPCPAFGALLLHRALPRRALLLTGALCCAWLPALFLGTEHKQALCSQGHGESRPPWCRV